MVWSQTTYIVKTHVLGASRSKILVGLRLGRGPGQWGKNRSQGEKNPTFYLAPAHQNTTKIRPRFDQDMTKMDQDTGVRPRDDQPTTRIRTRWTKTKIRPRCDQVGPRYDQDTTKIDRDTTKMDQVMTKMRPRYDQDGPRYDQDRQR